MKPKRKIIEIDEEKCTGCGLCIDACHEGALQLINGKAKLVSDSYCDGLGDCLPTCPDDAIRIIEREADPFDAALVAATQAAIADQADAAPLACGCPGTMARSITPPSAPAELTPSRTNAMETTSPRSNIMTWPVQLKLVPVNAPYLKKASLLIAADCTAYAAADFNARFMKGRVTLIGCPKLDEGDYSEKLTAILEANDIRRLTVVRMEVPCCGGIEQAVKQALQKSGKIIPWQVVTLGIDGTILEE